MSEAVRVMVVGAAGRMGRMVADAVAQADGLSAVAGLDAVAGGDYPFPLYTDLEAAVRETGPRVAIDFTVADAARANLPRLIALGVSPVVGTTGLTADEVAGLDALAREHGVPAFMAPNFAIGAVLMMRFAAEAARFFDYADIIEYHHEHKRDAPSGTALKTLDGMLAARGGEFRDTPVDETETLDRSRGGSRGFAHVHSVRMPGFVADQDVILGGPGETLRLSHRSVDRTCFMPGVVLAARRVLDLPVGLTVGLEALLG